MCQMHAYTFAFIPRNTVFRSWSSISPSLIFFTASASALSGTYRRFAGEVEVSVDLEAAGVEGSTEAAPREGEPGGVVDCAATCMRNVSTGICRCGSGRTTHRRSYIV
jgi:hypothetical protein